LPPPWRIPPGQLVPPTRMATIRFTVATAGDGGQHLGSRSPRTWWGFASTAWLVIM
jgi:hypothetical protein